MVEYFIDITHQDKFRAEILTAKKVLLETLKRCKLFKQVRQEKLDEIENLRNQLKNIIDLNGGKNLSSVSSKTNYLLAGDKIGPSKLKKANDLGISIISEQDFDKLIKL